MTLEAATSSTSNPKRPPQPRGATGFSSKRRRNGRNQTAKGSGGRKSLKPCCVVCGSDEAKYKCPKCREPYCKVSCCKEHKSRCPSLFSDDSQKTAAPSAGESGLDTSPPVKRSKYLASDALAEDPLENAVRRRRMLDEDSDSDEESDPGWRISRDMMDRLDGSSWLRRELADGGLRRIIAKIDCADEAAQNDRNGRSYPRKHPRGQMWSRMHYELSPRELALERAKRDNPNFANFIDRLLLTAGVLKGTGSDAVSVEQILLGDDDIGGLVLAPIAERAKPGVRTEEIVESDDESDETSSSSDSSESCSRSGTESSDE